MMELQTIPRAYVTVALRTARLPLIALERVAHRETDDTWPPGLAFDDFESRVKLVVGSVLRDDVLVHQGRLEQARVGELRDAIQLETVAEQTRAEAEQTYKARTEASEHKRQEAVRRARQREAGVERQRREAAAKADAEARRREQQAQQIEQERKRVIAKKARASKANAIAKEKAALTTAKSATVAKADALATEKKLRAAKAARAARRRA
jgi:hypothetical protein